MPTAPQELLQTDSEIVARALLSELLSAISVGLDSLGGKYAKWRLGFGAKGKTLTRIKISGDEPDG
jgi:hypothetical protein